jgi:hypothetical protein
MLGSGVDRFDYKQDPIELVKMSGARGCSLVKASEDFEFFVPYVPAVVMSNNYVDPLMVCRSAVGIPSKMYYWESPYQLVELGKVGRHLGLSSHVIFGLKKDDWATVSEHVGSINVKTFSPVDPKNSFVLHFGVQTLDMADPLAPSSKHYSGADDLRIKLNAFVINSQFWGIILRDHGIKKFGLPTFFRITVKQSLADPKSEYFVKAVIEGVAPDDSLGILNSSKFSNNGGLHGI